MICPACRGTGRALSGDPCGATIQVGRQGHETVRCWYDYKHDGPHAALLCSPCEVCGGYDEHAQDCGAPDAGEPLGDWYAWRDGGVLEITDVEPPWEHPPAVAEKSAP